MRRASLLLVLLLGLAGCTGTAPPPPRADIVLAHYAFAPGNFTAHVGQEVAWRNDDATFHTVTSDGAGPLASPSVGPQEVFRHTFTAAGTYPYHCTPHPFMVGNVTVVA